MNYATTASNGLSEKAVVVPKAAIPWIILAVFAALVPMLSSSLPWLNVYPAAAIAPLAEWINIGMTSFAYAVKPVSRLFAAMLEWPMLRLRDVLQWIPWQVSVLLVSWVAWRAAGLRLTLLCFLAVLFIALSGYWQQSMNTMALVGIAVPLSLGLGLLFGILAHRTKTGMRIVPPMLDLMQTMPTFAYLIPLLVIFGFGPVVGLIASAIYACPPMVRNVHLGLKQVPDEITEAARISGSSSLQQLFWVELPAAIGQIKVGINQTIMAALSMVIIASVIGGFDDIGWEVLSTMRKARFGESLVAGSVIVLIAIVMDRISSAYTERSRRDTKRSGSGSDMNNPASFASVMGLLSSWKIVLISLTVLTLLLKLFNLDQALDTPGWISWIIANLDEKLEAIVIGFGNQLTEIKNTFFFYYLLPLRIGFSQAILPYTWGFDFTSTMRIGYAVVCAIVGFAIHLKFSWRSAMGFIAIAYVLYMGLTGAPWLVLLFAITLMVWQVGGVGLGLFTLCALGFIAVNGLWDKAMLSVYLCGAAAIFAFVLGASIGAWAALSNTVSVLFRPISDTFQTIPLFVFLIPVLMFFQVGEFTALLAIVAYAFVPAVRYTESGLRQVPKDLLEVAIEQGATSWQIFWQVRLPLAMPSILVGLNQTIMYAFAMLVIAALVGTTGLGQQVFVALGSADTGLGVVAGLSMALLAIIADRTLQAWAQTRFGRAELIG